MATKIRIRKYVHCSNCSFYEASTTMPDGIERTAESGERGSKDEAIGRLIRYNPDVFSELEFEYEGLAKEEHDRISKIIGSLREKVESGRVS